MVWAGSWAAERLGIRLHSVAGEPLESLVGLAVRRNPRRVQLLVSSVLGKHVPTDPYLVRDAGLRLGGLVADALAGESAVVLGYAETATGLGHLVADRLGAPYLHSTRRQVAGVVTAAGFVEAHSHATSHLLQPENPRFLERRGDRRSVLVLVDDELSTGSTALNTIHALHAARPRDRYVIASLVDLRSADDRARMDAVAADLGATITCVALGTGEVELPPDLADRAAALLADPGLEATEPRPAPTPRRAERIVAPWPVGVPEGGRHGVATDPTDPARRAFDDAVAQTAAAVAATLPDGPVHVLGFEELMYTPLRVAVALADRGHPATYSTTTRSPVVAIDADGYAIRTALTFPAHDPAPVDEPGVAADEDPRVRYAYNLRAGEYAAIVLVIDAAADTPELDTLLARLRSLSERVVLVTLPAYTPGRGTSALPRPLTGPAFGSYPAEDVAWLLKDLSGVALEAPTEEREEAIQSGGAHYAESLPVEYQPDADYQALFAQALEESAQRLAYAVGLVTEQVLALRGRGVVLASLARAGTPVGVLMRRWARQVHDLDVPHYGVSIVRGRGIDQVALRYLAAHHRPEDVMFVDGWTGKGAIARELAAAIEAHNAAHAAAQGGVFDPALAVLADTGSCVRVFGTREDYLIPSACLNSTVSGLVSRTVLNRDLIGPGEFHGAKFYADLAAADVSGLFVDTVAKHFADVAERVAADLPGHLASDRAPTWAGWRVVEEVSAAYGIGDVNLVKPGVGETTRVLLRRVPWRILVNPARGADLGHVRMLAERRGVEVEEVEGLPYSCIGLIHPRFTRGAVFSDGTGGGSRRDTSPEQG